MEPSSRAARVTIAGGLAIGIVTLDVVLPAQHLAYAFVVPLILIARVTGLRAGLVLACACAIAVGALERVAAHTSLSWSDLPAVALHALVWFTTVYVVEHYEGVLVRSYRTASERAALEAERTMRRLERELPAAVRAEEAIARERDFAAIAEAIPQLVWRAAADGVAEYFNAAWLAYTGLRDAQLRDGGIEAAIHPADVERARERWSAALASDTNFDCEYRLRRTDGTYRWFLARATPLAGRDGEIDRWFGTCTDIDDQKRTQAQLERRYESAQHVSQTLQEASLPASLPAVRDIAFSATYRAGRHEAAIGGDWYDAMRLLDGRIVVSIGDVLGSGLAAAITMIAMRQAIRGAAHIVADPVAILEAADRTLREQQPEGIVTGFVGVYDPATQTLAYAAAGHPPPVLRRPGGELVELIAPGLPLGVRRKGDTEARSIAVEPGAFLTLYTDGLIEATRDVCEGERRLRDALGDASIANGPHAAERIAGAVLEGGASDDVAILTLAFDRGSEAHATHERRWPFDARDRIAACAAKRAFCAALAAAGCTEKHIADAEVVFAELLGNVVRHTPGHCTVFLDTDGDVPVLSVLDRGPGFAQPARLPPDALAESGRGLYIVRALTFEFSASPRPGGGTHARAVLAAQCKPHRPAPPPPTLAVAI